MTLPTEAKEALALVRTKRNVQKKLERNGWKFFGEGSSKKGFRKGNVVVKITDSWGGETGEDWLEVMKVLKQNDLQKFIARTYYSRGRYIVQRFYGGSDNACPDECKRVVRKMKSVGIVDIYGNHGHTPAGYPKLFDGFLDEEN